MHFRIGLPGYHEDQEPAETELRFPGLTSELQDGLLHVLGTLSRDEEAARRAPAQPHPEDGAAGTPAKSCWVPSLEFCHLPLQMGTVM